MPQTPKSPADLLADQFGKSFEKVKNQLVARAGPPPASDRVSQAKEDAMWAYADPKVDKDMLAQQIMTTGLSPELLDPNNPSALDIVHEHPDIVEALSQPTQDAETADMLARMVKYPFRWSALKSITDPDEQVTKANTLNRRYQASHQPMQIPGLVSQDTQSSTLSASIPSDGAPASVPAGGLAAPAGAPPLAPPMPDPQSVMGG